MRVRLQRWETHTLDGRRIYPRAPLVARVVLVALRPQYLVLRTREGEELWAQRSDGKVCGAKGGRASGSAPTPARWRGWFADVTISGMYVEDART